MHGGLYELQQQIRQRLLGAQLGSHAAHVG